ncbi:MAG: SsrA-binding protein SmpB [Verrucomicrobiota bacterium]|nr:SsrA-binding protein SmpB [Verrucomicrobiota bacterium]
MDKEIASNRKARHDYQILDTYEAGVVLTGTEVKSIRAGFVHINEAFARLEKDEVFLYNCDIQPYSHGNRNNHEPKRIRKLLLNRQEIHKLFGEISIKGHSLVALRMYFKKGRVKIELGVGKGKNTVDKRHDLKEKTQKRETERYLSSRRK